MSIATKLATDILSVAFFAVALFVLAAAIAEERWLVALGAVVALLLGMRISMRLCERYSRTQQQETPPRQDK